jgi:hypothetical protein
VKSVGYSVEVNEIEHAARLRRFSIPPELAGCHTAVTGGYLIEGHVPLEALAQLLRERRHRSGASPCPECRAAPRVCPVRIRRRALWCSMLRIGSTTRLGVCRTCPTNDTGAAWAKPKRDPLGQPTMRTLRSALPATVGQERIFTPDPDKRLFGRACVGAKMGSRCHP